MSDRRLVWLVTLIGLSGACALVASDLFFVFEKSAFTRAPSAERAFTYGSRHMSSKHGLLYDIDAAAYFFEKTAELDARYPYVHHQLARVAFLKGDLTRALAHIDIEIREYGERHPNAYYMRGLIKGYAGLYDSAADDYEVFLKHHPMNWAGITDYSWVLLKAERFQEAANAAEGGLALWPESPWLLNTSAIALYELGEYEKALERAKKGVEASAKVTESEWLTAYPGNDPRTAKEGIATLRRSAEQNMHMIEAAIAGGAVQ